MILNNVTILKQGQLVKTDVYFEDGEIKTIKKGLSKDEDCSGLFLMPGLHNAHVHLSTYGYLGTAIGMKKYDYFDNYWFKAKKKRTEKDVYKAALAAINESLKQGVTHIDTMDTAIEPVVKALEETGINYTACIPLKDSHTEAGDVNDQLNRTMKLKYSTRKPRFAMYPRYDKDKYYPFVQPTFTGLYCDYDDEIDYMQLIDDSYGEYSQEVQSSIPLHYV